MVTLRDQAGVFFHDILDLSPSDSYLKELPLEGRDFTQITATVTDSKGRALVSYRPYVRGKKQPIAVHKPVKRPQEYETVEELFINGFHLEQYKQHNYDPRDYYLEGLSRDPGDIRCNTAMGRLALRDGKFKQCVEYCRKAIERLTCRNQHPADCEAFYLKGLALQYLGAYRDAYDTMYQAAWSYGYRSAACYQLAVMDCRNGDYTAALEHLEESLKGNAGHERAQNLRAAIYRHLGAQNLAGALSQEGIAKDPLDLWAWAEDSFHRDTAQTIRDMFGGKPENYLDVVIDYAEAGLYADALEIIALSQSDYPLLHYHKAYCLHMLGKDSRSVLEYAAAQPTGVCFPARLEDIAVLEYAIRENPSDANACYYLGSLYYDRFRYDEAIELWERCLKADSTHAKALRNLSIAYYDRRGDAASAQVCMEKAMEYRKDPRLLFEYQQLLKNGNASVDQRLAVYERNPDLLAQRDDCYLDRIVLLCQKGRYEEAIHSARIKHFHIYEGGEGNLTKQHAWMHVLYANELAAQGNQKRALEIYQEGIHMPKSYGEAKTWFNQEAYIYYYMGNVLKELGRGRDAMEAYEEASVYKAAVSELSMFRALALRKLMRFTQAQEVLQEMITAGDALLKDPDLRPYYGVGAPTPMPFEYDIVRQNTANGRILRGYALLGLGRREEAEREIALAWKQLPNDFRIYAFHQVKNTVSLL